MKPKAPQDERQHFEAMVYWATRSLGWLLPCTQSEVEQTVVDETILLPPKLRDPLAALARRSAPKAKDLPSVDGDVVEQLAQAARQGARSISPEVADRMRRDRESAERDADAT
jgi:hypothetical protein